jgi:hypothetical protein
MQEKIGSWSLRVVVTKSHDQENYLSHFLVTSVKTPLMKKIAFFFTSNEETRHQSHP